MKKRWRQAAKAQALSGKMPRCENGFCKSAAKLGVTDSQGGRTLMFCLPCAEDLADEHDVPELAEMVKRHQKSRS